MTLESLEETPLLEEKKKDGYKFSLWEKYTSCRWQVGATAAFTMSCSILLRLNMTMVVVCMAPGNLTVTVVQNGSEFSIRDPYLDNYVYWDSTMEGLLISGYYFGQVFTSLIFGTLSGRVSSKNFILFLTSVLIITSCVTPAITFVDPYLVLAARIVIGIATGGLEPCGTQLLSNWAPLPERSQMMSITEQGNYKISFGFVSLTSD
ncbi:sodium-dependent phosphate transport protein 1-like [Argopecten irradians]|uniref:sodium-dependent phosphate transport protein 1-like n=1 Tax=Argopecten irradians TaxID=31199 RepID=UPI0037131BAA